MNQDKQVAQRIQKLYNNFEMIETLPTGVDERVKTRGLFEYADALAHNVDHASMVKGCRMRSFSTLTPRPKDCDLAQRSSSSIR